MREKVVGLSEADAALQRLGDELYRRPELNQEEVGLQVLHEEAHILADEELGIRGGILGVDESGAFYMPLGPRTALQWARIALAPEDRSPRDMQTFRKVCGWALLERGLGIKKYFEAEDL